MDEHDFSIMYANKAEKARAARRILGVAEDAGAAEIKKAFWLLAMQYHPDREPDNQENLEKFKRILAAYEFLAKGRDAEFDAQGKDAGEMIGEFHANSWGYFCWWQDAYMDDGGEKKNDTKRAAKKRPARRGVAKKNCF